MQITKAQVKAIAGYIRHTFNTNIKVTHIAYHRPDELLLTLNAGRPTPYYTRFHMRTRRITNASANLRHVAGSGDWMLSMAALGLEWPDATN